jgi:hypothetical protein
MRTAIYLIAIVNILLGLYMIYKKHDVFRGRTLKDAGRRDKDKKEN